ncbi:Winged helix-turn-helix transcription repressor DNA-binding [Penicillium alfredii]|uniref:Winged helix-turn-helix transcription repressor DNA-binding n=1 Tax=Penicillium alfredii TaxID=1506179 RepID=A0A9W9F8E5_9EURO|nr:Winged helix-turn-helix transcription repressor DNA-binding [Penicillium alfredii]KAJ5095540.1 Winged helix-turn-helix transcription repressor DNA-binding [Penicillium alfredii]
MSSQTMTAPAVGHRPPDPGPESPIYDYGSHNDASPSQPGSDSAMRDMQNNSAPSTPPQGLSATNSIGIKTEPTEDQSLSAPSNQRESNTQSAASALLAQLLGNQSSPNSAPASTAPLAGLPNERQDVSGDVKMDEAYSQMLDTMGPDVTTADPNLQQPSTVVSGGMQDMSNGDSFGDSLAGLGAAHQGDSAGPKTSDAMEGLSDPLNSKSNPEQPSLLPPFDFAAAPKNAFEALQQNELLTAAYLSQGADLSALGYQDGAASVAGSEPRIQAFAKLEFDDGHFYVNTYSFILGRDVRAARAAHQREIQYRQAVRSSRAKSSSGGNTSHTPNRVKQEESAAMMGSVVSDRGGIMGFDPDVPPHLPANIDLSRRSSKSSYDDSVVPLHATPAQLQSTTDYNALAMQSLQEGNGDAKPVDTLALLPSPDSCPTIPIHPPTTVDGSAAGHRGISRRHVRIAYNFDRNLFEMEVMGRNGAFIGADWLSPGQLRPLHSGDYIQIGGVRIRFLLPDVPIGETGADRMEAQLAEEEDAASIDAEHELDEPDKVVSDSAEPKDSSKVDLTSKETDEVPSIEAGEQPARRRGPGRPPKDGIMSKRERAELAREQKMAAKREANGGVTPPPNRGKAGKTTTKESVGAESPTPKPSEKRKYTKRKKPDGTSVDVPIPSTEGGQLPAEQRPEESIKPPPVKKRKPSRSPSPNYPPESAYSQEDLAKPPYNYAVLIFDALTDAGTPMTLKQIYRALKLKYPYFRFKCETEGWTSSVRHNLNGNSHLFMHAERDGKGWSWQLRPGASVEKEKKRRPSPPPAPPQVSQPPPNVPQQYMPPMSHSYAPPPVAPAPAPNQHQHQHFQFPSIPPAPFPTPAAPQHSSPYPPPSTAPAPAPTVAPAPPAAPTQAPATTPTPNPASSATPAAAPKPTPAPASFPIPSTIRNSLPAAFAQTIPSTYTSPYASDTPAQGAQARPSQTPRPPQGPPQHQSPYPPQKPISSHPPHINPQPQAFPPPAGPPFQPKHQPPAQPRAQPPSHPPPQRAPPSHHPPPQQHPLPGGPPTHQQPQPPPAQPNSAPSGPSESSSFTERANKAIDDFEAVLMEDYEDKNYIREVLRSARARVLGAATESSFPGGEPKDEAVIMDVLGNLVGSLKDE